MSSPGPRFPSSAGATPAPATARLSAALESIATGALAEITRALEALGDGDIDGAHATTTLPAHVAFDLDADDPLTTLASGIDALRTEVSGALAALEHARENLGRSEREQQLGVMRQSMIARLGRLALDGVPLDEFMVAAVEGAASALDLAAAAVLQHDDDLGFLTMRAAARVPRGRRDLEFPRADAARPNLTGRAEPGSRLSHVISGAEGTPWGVLAGEASGPRRFEADEVDFIHALANVLASAIANRASEAHIRHQALHDPLTGLPNRALFDDRLRLALAHSARRGTGVGVLFVDLDHFKLVNDSLGHTAGDRLLVGVARRLDSLLRPGDTVARFGGDEFVIICDDLAGPAEAERIARRVQSALGRPLNEDDDAPNVRASIGIAYAQGGARSAEDLVREADAAMYRAKEHGRGRHEMFDERMRDYATTRLRLETEIAHALDAGELALAYQPIVSLWDGRVQAVEALLRWNRADGANIGPAEFVPVTEETGLIGPIGDWVLEQACTQAARWAAQLPPGEPVRVAVNVSSREGARPSMVERVATVLQKTGLAPGCLQLEITESVLMEHSDQSLQTLQGLKSLGVRLALDDFGTGYSSLAYVKRLPLDVLKVDRSFVTGVVAESPDAKILEAIISMARGLGLDVIGEGVESGADAAVLSDLGARYAQGFHYARPMRADALSPLLESTLPYELGP